MPAQRVAKLEALLARVQTRAAESRSRRGSPALNVAPIVHPRFDGDEVTGKLAAVAESPRVQPPPLAAVAAKSAPKIAAAPPASPVVRHVEPAPVAVASAAPPLVVDPPPFVAHAAPEVVPQVFTPPPAPVQAIAEPALPPGFSAPQVEPAVAPARTPSPVPVAIAKVAEAKPAAAARPAAVVPAAVVTEALAPRGRQFAVAVLLMLWILVVAAVVGLFFTGRLPMPM